MEVVAALGQRGSAENPFDILIVGSGYGGAVAAAVVMPGSESSISRPAR